MKTVATLALTSFREMIRERLFIVVAGLAFFLVALSLLLGEMTLDESERLLADLGLLAAELATVSIALFSGAYVLARELERQTCLLILSKPVSRFQFLVGKWCGTAILLMAMTIVMDVTLNLLLGRYSDTLLISSSSILVKSLILLSWALFASTFVRPVLALFSGICLYLLGHWLTDLAFFAEKSKQQAPVLAVKVLRWIVPNFDLFNWKDHFHLVQPPELRDIIGMGLHGAAWVILLLAAAGLIFRRKDLV